jgi:hypothetical protein
MKVTEIPEVTIQKYVREKTIILIQKDKTSNSILKKPFSSVIS